MNLILTAYLTSGKDGHKGWEPKRNDHREKNVRELEPLLMSLYHKNIKAICLHDCFTDPETEIIFNEWWNPFVKCRRQTAISSNAYRWLEFLVVLRGSPEAEYTFLVDSTDVECYINPFNSNLGDFLWTGDEKHSRVDNPWMKTHQQPYVTMSDYQEIIYENRKHRLLNCGIIGGKREIVLEYLELMVKYQSECNLPDNISVDMAVHNYILFKHFKNRFKHGEQVNTVFRKNEKPNGISWFRHK